MGRHGRDRMLWSFDLQLLVQSVSNTTKFVSSNPVHGEVYSIQHYVVKFKWRATDRWFSSSTPVSSTNKNDAPRNNWNIQLKVAFNIINQTKPLKHEIPLSWVACIFNVWHSKESTSVVGINYFVIDDTSVDRFIKYNMLIM